MVFGLIDEQGFGYFGPKELRAAFAAVNMSKELSIHDVRVVFARTAEPDQCTYDEFEVSLLPPLLRALSCTGCSQELIFSSSLLSLHKFVLVVRTYKDMFGVFDRDGNGVMSARELGKGLTKLFRWRPTQYESEKILSTVDDDNSGEICFAEFVRMLNCTRHPALDRMRSELDELHQIFKCFDIDSTETTPDFIVTIKVRMSVSEKKTRDCCAYDGWLVGRSSQK